MTQKTKLYALISAGLFALMMLWSGITVISNTVLLISRISDWSDRDFSDHYLIVVLGGIALLLGALLAALLYFAYAALTALSLKTKKPSPLLLGLCTVLLFLDRIWLFVAGIPNDGHAALFFWYDLFDYSFFESMERFLDEILTTGLILNILRCLATQALFLVAVLILLLTIQIPRLRGFSRISWLLPPAALLCNAGINWIWSAVTQFIYLGSDDMVYTTEDLLRNCFLSLVQILPVGLLILCFAAMGFWMMKWVEDTRRSAKRATASATVVEQ